MAVKRLFTTWHRHTFAHTHTCTHTHSYIYTNLPILLFRSKFKWDQYFILSLHFRFHWESTVLAAAFHSVLFSKYVPLLCPGVLLHFSFVYGKPLSIFPQSGTLNSFLPLPSTLSLLVPLFSLTIIWTRGIVNLFALISVFRKVCIFKWTIRATPPFKLFN